MRREEADKFCQIAQANRLLKPEQVAAYHAQARTGIQSPAAFFLLGGELKRDEVDQIFDELSADVRGSTKILKMEDTVLQMRPQGRPASSPPSPPPVIPENPILDMEDSLLQMPVRPQAPSPPPVPAAAMEAEEIEVVPDPQESEIIKASQIMNMEDTALHLPVGGMEMHPPAPPRPDEADVAKQLLHMEDSMLQLSARPPAPAAGPVLSPFIETALRRGDVTEPQISDYQSQVATGFQDAATYFLLSGILLPEQIDQINAEAARAGTGGTQILSAEDTVLQMRRVEEEPPPAEGYIAEEVSDAPPPPPAAQTPTVHVTPKPMTQRPVTVPTLPTTPQPSVRRPVTTPPPSVRRPATAPTVPTMGHAVRQRPPPPSMPTPPTMPPLSAGASAAALKNRPPVLGRYMILGELGRGGMGIVYKAHDIALNRTVAIKVLKGDDFTPQEVGRFMKEGRLAGGLAHPNLVTVFDTQSENNQHFIVMEFIEGKTLEKLVEADSGKTSDLEKQRIAEIAGIPVTMSPQVTEEGTATTAAFQKVISTVYSGSRRDPATLEILRVLVQVANALQFAHDRQIIHRDIKPQNIIVDKRGIAKVMDFGLAKDVGAQSMNTASGTIMGTPQYMSPEQAQGDVRNLDNRSDVYSYAAVLYFCFCGIPPFEGTTIYETLQKVVNDEPPKPMRIKPGMDRELEVIILKGLEKDKTRRYGSMREIGDDLERFIRGERIQAQAPDLAYQVKKKIRKSRKLQLTLTAAAVLMAAGGYYWYWSQGARQQLAEAGDRDARRKEASKHLEAAVGQRGKAALESYGKALEVLPDYEEALIARCRVHYMMGNYDPALTDAQAAEKRSPALAAYWMGRVTEAKGGKGSAEKAEDHYKKASKGGGDEWYVQVAGANIHRMKGEWDQAIDLAGKALTRDENLEEARLIRGTALVRKEKPEEAVKDYDVALKGNRDNVEILMARVAAFLFMRDFAKALVDCEEVIRVNDKYGPVYYQRGRIFKEQKNYPAMVKDWSNLLVLDPKHEYEAEIRKELDKYGGVIGEVANMEQLQAQAREEIKGRAYGKALEKIYRALELQADDPTLHWYAWRLCLRQAKDRQDLGERRRLLTEAFDHEFKWRKNPQKFDPVRLPDLLKAFPAGDKSWEKVPWQVEAR